MKRFSLTLPAILLGFAVAASVHARQDDIDVSRLTSSLDQLAHDPSLGSYAQAEQARARDAIARLAQASRKERPHDLYLAERRVDLDAQLKLTQLDREHDQILLENSRRDAEMARRELERQRMQYQMAQEEAARLQAQGQAYSEAADQARAEAEQAKKLAAAQSKVAKAAKREAALAAKAAKAMRSQMEGGDTGKSKQHEKPEKQHEKPDKKHPHRR
jgi:membrane protein involved in colicin uptake